MFNTLPKNALDALEWKIDQYEPYYQDLIQRAMTAENVNQWLADWSAVGRMVFEVYARLYLATALNTTDDEAQRRMNTFLESVYPQLSSFENQLQQKLLASGLQPGGFEIPLRNIRVESEIFREENLPLITEEQKVAIEYDKIIGAQTVEWEGEEKTIVQLTRVYQDHDRTRRERAWRLIEGRRLADRDALNALWKRFMDLRRQIATNAGFPDYRMYAWKGRKRFDYTPADSETFHKAIEQVAVPAANHIYQRRRERLGVDALRPWDVGHEPMRLGVDVAGRPPLHPYQQVEDLENGMEAIFNRVDPQLGAYFKTMRAEKMFDLDNRKGKAPGGFCMTLPVTRRPFIFMNAVGVHDDVQTLLHEGGHAFHAFESIQLPYFQLQNDYPFEFAEVASMSMELIGGAYLLKSEGGFYSEEEAARARVEFLERIILFWPYMAVVDAFQHWVYTNHEAATNPANCDAKWAELWDRFIPGIDYSGLEDTKMTGWHHKPHIFQNPFYYIEYGLAQLGAVQVWASALENQAEAVKNYRRALALGGSASLPELFSAAGAKFAFDAGTLTGAVTLVERVIDQLDHP